MLYVKDNTTPRNDWEKYTPVEQSHMLEMLTRHMLHVPDEIDGQYTPVEQPRISEMLARFARHMLNAPDATRGKNNQNDIEEHREYLLILFEAVAKVLCLLNDEVVEVGDMHVIYCPPPTQGRLNR